MSTSTQLESDLLQKSQSKHELISINGLNLETDSLSSQSQEVATPGTGSDDDIASVEEETIYRIKNTLDPPHGTSGKDFKADTSSQNSMDGRMCDVSENDMKISGESSDYSDDCSVNLDEPDDESDDDFILGKSPRKRAAKRKQAKLVRRNRQWGEDKQRKLAYGYIAKISYKQIIADALHGHTVSSLKSKIYDLKQQKRLTKARNGQWVYWDTK